MATALKAHFDGEKILLDEPFDLPRGASLLITIITTGEQEQIAKSALARAYGDNEPGYSLDDLV